MHAVYTRLIVSGLHTLTVSRLFLPIHLATNALFIQYNHCAFPFPDKVYSQEGRWLD